MLDPDPRPRQAYFTRSQTATAFKAAGVLPFAVHSGQVLVLLGAEPTRTGPSGKVERIMWRDFGGQREAIDIDVEACASREFAEETLGIFGGCGVNASSVAASACTMADQLRRNFSSLHVIHPLKKGEYHMFCAQTTYIEPLMFYLAIQQNEHTKAVTGAEKTAFAWVHLPELLSAVATCGRRYDLHTNAAISGSEVNRKLWARGTRRLQLHPCFAKSLRLAKEAGLLNLVTGAKALPLPPPACMPPMVAFPATMAERTCSEESLGITPEHLLYWTQQEEVASVLYGPGSAECIDATAFPSADPVRCSADRGSDIGDDACIGFASFSKAAHAVLREGGPEALAGTEGIHMPGSQAPVGCLEMACEGGGDPHNTATLCSVWEGHSSEGAAEASSDPSGGVDTCDMPQRCVRGTATGSNGPVRGSDDISRHGGRLRTSRAAFGQGTAEALAGLSVAAALWRESRETLADVGARSILAGPIAQHGRGELSAASSEVCDPVGHGTDGMCCTEGANHMAPHDAGESHPSQCEARVSPLEGPRSSRGRGSNGTPTFGGGAVASSDPVLGLPRDVQGGRVSRKRPWSGAGGG